MLDRTGASGRRRKHARPRELLDAAACVQADSLMNGPDLLGRHFDLVLEG